MILKIEEIEQVIKENKFLIITGYTSNNQITVNIKNLKERIKLLVGKSIFNKNKEIIIEQTEKARDRMYSSIRYQYKIKTQSHYNDDLEYNVLRTKNIAKNTLGEWIIDFRDWDTIGVLTFKDIDKDDTNADIDIRILFNHLKSKNVISDYVYFIESASCIHGNFFVKCSKHANSNTVRKAIRTFWRNHYGHSWVKKYNSEKASRSYWTKDIYSKKIKLDGCNWDLEYDINPLKINLNQ